MQPQEMVDDVGDGTSVRVRPTVRCLQDDLNLALPTPRESLDDFKHPVIEAVRGHLRGGAAGTLRVDGREVALHEDADTGRWWICNITEVGGACTLPATADTQRLADERTSRLLAIAKDSADDWLLAARGTDRDLRFGLDEGAEIVLAASDDGQSVCVALPKLNAAARGLDESTRAMIFAVLAQSPVTRNVEPLDDLDVWPGVELINYEMALYELEDGQ